MPDLPDRETEQDLFAQKSASLKPREPREPREPRDTEETDSERRRRRARFLRELAEARELRNRVQPRRVKAARLRHAMRMQTFRW
jgi:hypothetical protein